MRTPRRMLIASALVAFSVTAIYVPNFGQPHFPECPKVLMFDGVDIKTQNNQTMAKYWGKTIGVQGFFLNNVMADWDVSVGDDENSTVYQNLKRFQETYSKYGVTDNFIKVALYTIHDWRDHAAQSRVVENFRQAAHLAHFAGLKGIAFDLEPYKATWNEDPSIPDKPEQVYLLGRRIGGAILSEFPQARIIVLPEILVYMQSPSHYGKAVLRAYALSPRFWDGLVQAHFAQVIVASERSYSFSQPNKIAEQCRQMYRANLASNGIDSTTVPIALGIWPLGKTYTDKSARCTPEQFKERLQLAFREGSPYVWIYGHGSAWQKNGPYGKGDVDQHFKKFVKVLHQVKKSCGGSR